MEVDIGTETFTVFADIDTADIYATGAIHAATWRAAATDDKGRWLVTSTRLLNRQIWKGTKVDADQALAFPRESMGITPEPVLNSEDIPVDIQDASIELAFALSDGSEVQTQGLTGSRIRSMSAGSVSITNFRNPDGSPTRFPQIVQELVAKYLGGTDSTLYPKATGVDTESVIANLDLGYSSGGLLN